MGREMVWDTRTAVMTAADLQRSGGTVTVRPEFVLPDGEYRLLVVVTDSASGTNHDAEALIRPLREETPVSDLLLEPLPALDSRGTLDYYLELYNWTHAVAGSLVVHAEDSSGAVRWVARRETVAPFAGVLRRRGTVDRDALPPGRYRLVATADLGGRTESRVVTFDVPAPMAAPEDMFSRATEAELDSLYGPVFYLLAPMDRGVYPALPLAGRREFLRDFWTKRDPSPNTVRNEAQDRFYERVQQVNQRYTEGGVAPVPGWRTDRGRIFLRYGRPDIMRRRPAQPDVAGYEVWKYMKNNRVRKYVFLDLTRFGNYTLIWSNDPDEPRLPNWRLLLGSEASDEALRF
jgi:GWxTD domain-containing protein